MKKGKKEIKGTLEPQPITYRFTPDKMIFSINGQEFFLPQSAASFLFGKNVDVKFEKANNQDEDFSKFETTEALSLFSFHSKRYMPLKEIAKELDFPVDKYVRWLSRRGALVTKLMRTNKFEIDKRVAKLEEENPLPEPKKEKEFWPDSHGKIGRKVAEMLLDGLGPRQIAENLKISYGQFSKWFSNKDTQRIIIRIRSELFEKRARKNEEIKEEL